MNFKYLLLEQSKMSSNESYYANSSIVVFENQLSVTMDTHKQRNYENGGPAILKGDAKKGHTGCFQIT